MVYIINGKVMPGKPTEPKQFNDNKTTFSGAIGPKPGNLPAVLDRYALCVAYACPFASRVLATMKLKKLDHVFDVWYMKPNKNNDVGWEFAEETNGFNFLHQVYTASDSACTTKVSVPVLWDKKTQKIVNNESAEISRMLNNEFNAFTDATIDLYPKDLATSIDELNSEIGNHVNNGVYKVVLSPTQDIYETHCKAVFKCLDGLEERLSKQRYLVSNTHVTESDIRLFVSLVRFDAAYYPIFKCNIKRISDYPNLSNFVRDIYQIPGISDTVNIREIVIAYTCSFASKPRIPIINDPKFDFPHDRFKFASASVSEALKTKGQEDDAKQTDKAKGVFVRGTSKHRDVVTVDGSSGFKAEKGRYHLLVANNCPWSHRTIIARKLKGLEDVVTMDILYWKRDAERGWQYNPEAPGCTKNTVNDFKYITEFYESVGSKEKSVPVLWDRKTNTIVNNESSEIIRIFNSGFGDLASSTYDLYPSNLAPLIDYHNAWIYPEINNGAYKAGFASAQDAYEKAYNIFFRALDKLELVFATNKYVCGDKVTEADVRLLPTIFRFDHVYYTRFNLNKAMIREGYLHTFRWLKEMLALPGVLDASNLEHCKNGYFGRTGNNLIPVGPDFGF